MFNAFEDSAEEDEDIVVEPVRKKRALDDPSPGRDESGPSLLRALEFEEEVDEPLAERQVSEILLDKSFAAAELAEPAEAPVAAQVVVASDEFLEAQAAIAEDTWDVSSWMILLDEVEHGHGGALSLDAACEMFLRQFPRCAKIWQKLSEHWRTSDAAKAEQVLLTGAKRCWNVELWLSYLRLVLLKYKAAPSREQQRAEQTKCEAAFELALDQVGLAADSSSLWRAYIAFIKNWPAADALDKNESINALRRAYKRVVCSAIDNVDKFWTQYEDFERELGVDVQNDSEMQEIHKKHLHCKSVWRERKEKVKNIVFDRLSTPPTNAASEIQQLDFWSSWISFEQSNPDYLHADACNSMVRMVFQQCLCCFLYNPEVWLAFARFEQRTGSEPGAARAVLQQAVQTVPESALLRVALAEFEEQCGCLDAAKEVYRAMFEHFVDGFSFSLYQRFVRRTLGVAAGRKLFSETFSLRSNNTKLSMELFLAHASTEFEMNISPEIALRTLSIARDRHPTILQNISFVKLFSRVLVQLGDLQQLRLLMRSAIDAIEKDDSTDALDTRSAKQSTNAHEICLRKEFELLGEFLNAEISLGLAQTQYLNQLRERRQKLKLQLDEIERARTGVAGKDDQRAMGREVFDAAGELIDRYAVLFFQDLPETDDELRDRCRDSNVLVSTKEKDTKKRTSDLSETKHLSTEFHLSLSGLPSILRDFVAQLPPHFGGQPDCEGFLRHMKSIILPPRPQPSQSDELKADGDTMAVDDEEPEVDLKDAAYNDIFRQRQRMGARP